jgi:hypothetical protein
MTTEDMDREGAVTLMAIAPERAADLVGSLGEARLRYRHGPAFPTVKEAVAHLVESGLTADAVLRQVYLEKVEDAPLRAALEPTTEPDLATPTDELLQSYARSRRRTIDLLRGMSDEDTARELRDPAAGRLTLLDACRAVARHEMGHLSQIRNLIAVLPETQDLGPVSTH